MARPGARRRRPDCNWTAVDRTLDKEVLRAVHGIEESIFDTPAATLAGRKAKAEILHHMDTALGVPTAKEYAASLVVDIMAQRVAK